MTQARFSATFNDGYTDFVTRKSMGYPAWISNASKPASGYTWNNLGTPAYTSGNPLQPENYWHNWKWGNPLYDKWTTAGGRPTDEANRNYEGEIFSGNCISFVNEVPFILSILT